MRRLISTLLSAALILASPGTQAYAAMAKTQAPTGITLPFGPAALAIQPQAPILPIIPSGLTASQASIFSVPSTVATVASPAKAAGPAATAKAFQALDLKPLAQPSATAETVSGLGGDLERVLTGARTISASAAMPVAGSAARPAASGLKPYYGNGGSPGNPGPPRAELNKRITQASRAPKLARTAWTTVTIAAPLAAFGVLIAKAGILGLISWTSLAAVAIMFTGLILEVTKRGSAKETLNPKTNRGIYEDIQNLSIAAHIKMPAVLSWKLPFPNAAASGTPKESFIQITPALTRLLRPDQLTGVLAHEISHVAGRDTKRLMVTRLLGTLLTLSLLNLHVSLPLFVGVLAANKLAQAAMDRSMERLADLGAAKLTGKPDQLGSGLLRIDLWARLMKGKTDTVGLPGFHDLADNHPSVLRRVELLARLLDPASPSKRGGTGALRGFYPSAASLLNLLAKPLLLGMTLLVLPVWLWPLMLVARKYVSKFIAHVKTLGDAPGVTADRLRAYLEHPSAEVRRWAQQARGFALMLRPEQGDQGKRQAERLDEIR